MVKLSLDSNPNSSRGILVQHATASVIMKLLGVLLIVCAAIAEDTADREEGKSLQEYNQDWQPADYVSPWPQPENDKPKRRRIRKRKRRPPVFTSEEADILHRPPKLEPWEEMSSEAAQKTNNRRRLTPIYDATEEIQVYEKIRDPFTALQEAEEKQRKTIEDTNTPDLKTLLKQSGSMSLSEVLQQRNLSLSELLRGNKDAISALVTTTEAATDRKPEDETERFPGVTKVDVVTEEATERRIFVPRRLPMTSAKLKKMTQETTTHVPEKAVSINVGEIFGLQKEADAPFKMSIDLVEVVTTEVSTTTSQKLKRVTAKEEILEILKDPVEGERLSKILHTRNMTVDELVAQRERGSSQVHLADIFHNKTREPEPKEEAVVGQLTVFNRKGKTLQETTTAAAVSTTKLPYSITSFPTYKIETNKDVKPFLPLWQQLYPSFFTNVHEDNHLADKERFVRPSTTSTERVSYDDLERIEEIENALSEAAEQLKVEPPRNLYDDDDDEEEFIKLPSGVKSAILASLAIIGLSLVVFLTILVIFKWSQKRRLNYNGSFSGSKIRSPILEPDQRRTFRNFVSETLGKKRNYYKQHLQSMSDSIWDREEKKSYMI